MGSAVASTRRALVPIPLVNVSDQECLIRRGTTVAVMTPTENIQPWDPADSPGPQINAALTAEPPRKPETRPRRSQEDVPEQVKVLMDGLLE